MLFPMVTVGPVGLLVSGLFAPYPHQQFSLPGCQPSIAQKAADGPGYEGPLNNA